MDMTAEEIKKREQWDFALGLIKVDGLEPTEEYKELVEKEIRGEITLDDIEKYLHDKYKPTGDKKND